MGREWCRVAACHSEEFGGSGCHPGPGTGAHPPPESGWRDGSSDLSPCETGAGRVKLERGRRVSGPERGGEGPGVLEGLGYPLPGLCVGE